MKPVSILIISILAIGFFIVVGLGIVFVQMVKQGNIIPTPQPTNITASPSITLNPTGTVEQDKRNIRVFSPINNQRISLPIVIKGEARVFENQLNYRVRDVNKTIILEGNAYANSPDTGQYGDYVIQITSLPPMRANAITLEVFDYSAKDGEEIDTVSISVIFDPTNSIPVTVFFGSKKAPTGEECTSVYPIEHHVAKTQAIARATLEELLKGPMIIEKNKGYYTSINEGVKIQKLTISDGIARVDFNKTLEEGGGGSCRIAAIRTQISQTLKQFPTIKDVIISIDGRTEDILQP